MKKLLINCLIILFISLIGLSATPILKTGFEAIPPGSFVRANFIQQRYLTGITNPIFSQGELILWDGKGLIWKTTTPFPNAILITQKGLYQLEDGQRIPVMKANQIGLEGTVFTIMSKVLRGSLPEIKGFKLKPSSSMQGEWKVSLTPSHSTIQNFISSIVVEGKKRISHITIYRSNGDKDEISLTSYTIFDSQSIDRALTLQEKAFYDD